MNFLAHCLLAAPGDGLLAGGVLGDFVKGPIPATLPPELRLGVRLHRRIDAYSNRLAEMKASYAHFDPALRRAAPVLLDILADHLLALGWPRYAQQDMDEFVSGVHAALGRYQAHVPAPSRAHLRRLVENNVLARYAEPRLVRGAMEHVLRRLRFEHLIERLDPLLDTALPDLQSDFDVYFPLLQAFAASEREGGTGGASGVERPGGLGG